VSSSRSEQCGDGTGTRMHAELLVHVLEVLPNADP
jgi:hypothetical protein